MPWSRTTASTTAATWSGLVTLASNPAAFPPRADDRPDGLVELVLLDVHETDVGPEGGQVLGDGQADPLAGAGDDGNAALETHHPPAPFNACSNRPISDWIRSWMRFMTNSRLIRTAFLTARAFDRPWPMMQTPLRPSRWAPPYSE